MSGSVPNGVIIQGEVWTADQWNSAWESKVDGVNGALAGTPTAPTATPGDNSTRIATTAFVGNATAAYLPLAGGSVSGALNYTATGGSVSRSAQDRAATVANVRDFGAVGDGVTSDTAAIQAAVNYAATFTPPRSVYLPSGTYLIGSALQLGTVSGQRWYGDENGTVLLVGPVSTANPALINVAPGCTNCLLERLIFDGNSANTSNLNALVILQGYSDRMTFLRCHFRNTNNSALSAPGDQPIGGNVSVTAAVGQPTLTFSAIPAGVKPGAYLTQSALIDPDMYVVSTTATTVTLNRNLTDTVLSGSGVNFTCAFTTSADTFYGDTVIPTADTSGLSVGQTLFIAGNGCFQSYTRITVITTNASVTVSRPLLNKLPSGSSVAASRGHSRLTVQDCWFINLGQTRMYGATATYNTSGVQASGQSNLVLRAMSASGATKLGVYPGQYTGTTTPAGVPANTLVKDLVSRSTVNNTYTITLASPLTGSVADNTPITFQTAQASAGYGIWLAWGACFSNIDAKIIHNRFEHTWVACIYTTGSSRTLCMGNFYIQDQMEYRDPNIAPSPFIACAGTMHMRIIGECGVGASGTGIEAQHPVGMVISGCDFSNNGLTGIGVAGGHDNIVNGALLLDNGQYLNIPLVQDYAALGTPSRGLYLGGSATFSQPGTLYDTSVSGVAASDTQNVPTQSFGIGAQSSAVSYTNLWIAPYVGLGNITATFDPLLINVSGRQAPRLLYQTSTLVGNGADTTQDVLQSFSVPANTLLNVGDRLVITAGGSLIGSTDTKTVIVRWGGQNLAALGASTGSQQGWRFEAEIMKTGPNAQTTSATFSTNSNQTAGGVATYTRTDTAAVVIDITGQNATNPVASSITCRYFTVDYVAAV